VTREPARTVVGRAHGALRDQGLHPVVIWPYDVGSASVFVVDAHAQHGAQFDILHDISGAGHYGVRAAAVLARAQPGARWNRAAPDDELLYLIRKRLRKGQRDRLAELLATAESAGGLGGRAQELFSGPSAAAVTAVLDGRPGPADPLRRVRAAVVNSRRIASRLRRPVGFWVAVQGEASRSTAEVVADRFARVLPTSGCGRTPVSPSELLRQGPAIAGVRWRAGVYASWGPVPARISTDLEVDTTNVPQQDALARIVTAMERRLRP
jgi:hypothetical protein